MSLQIKLGFLFRVGLALLATSAGAQELQLNSWTPRPFVYFSGQLNGAGYTTASVVSGSGLTLEKTRWTALAETSFDNAHKSDSGTGTSRHLQGRIFYRLNRNWYVGAGAQWNKLSTSLYNKQAWRPTVGGGRDWFSNDFSIRTQVMYIFPGTDHLNALQGPEVSIWLPSPKTRAHFFFRETVGIYEFHQTATPTDPGTQNRNATAIVQMGLMFRF
jgi:hypothetical protein